MRAGRQVSESRKQSQLTVRGAVCVLEVSSTYYAHAPSVPSQMKAHAHTLLPIWPGILQAGLASLYHPLEQIFAVFVAANTFDT